MPQLPGKLCRAAGCKALAAKGMGFCEKHRPLFDEQERKRRAMRRWNPAARRLYGLAAWREGRAEYLRANPLCKDCLDHGILEAATDVDHVIPHKSNRELFFDQQNWRGLCKKCHSTKTAREDGGFGNPIQK